MLFSVRRAFVIMCVSSKTGFCSEKTWEPLQEAQPGRSMSNTHCAFDSFGTLSATLVFYRNLILRGSWMRSLTFKSIQCKPHFLFRTALSAWARWYHKAFSRVGPGSNCTSGSWRAVIACHWQQYFVSYLLVALWVPDSDAFRWSRNGLKQRRLLNRWAKHLRMTTKFERVTPHIHRLSDVDFAVEVVSVWWPRSRRWLYGRSVWTRSTFISMPQPRCSGWYGISWN